MKKEFGKWLLDIAKYMVTVLLLSTILTDLERPLMIFVVIILVSFIVVVGLQLIDDEEEKNKKTKKK